MMRFGANVTQTALKGLNLAQAGNYDYILNLKYTCRALPSLPHELLWVFFLYVLDQGDHFTNFTKSRPASGVWRTKL